MRKQISFYTALVTLAMVGSSFAQTADKPNDISTSQIIQGPQKQIGEVTAIKLKALDAVEAQPGASRITQAMLNDIVTWLSSNFDLASNYNHPNVEFVPAARLATLRYSGLLPDRWHDSPATTASQLFDVVALYLDKKKTIYLADTWTGANPTELSILVHEMVHHLQNLGEIKYECPAAREKPAYLAQDEWLKRNGLDLEQALELDKLTLLVKTACMF